MLFKENGIVRIACIFLIVALTILECSVSLWTNLDLKQVEIGAGVIDYLENSNYRWLLLITVIISVPAVIDRIFDSLRSIQTEKGVVETLMRSCKMLTLVVPNIGLLIALTTNTFNIRRYDGVFGPQEVVIIATILSSTFGNSVFYGLEGIDHLLVSVEQSTLFLLVTFTLQRSIILVLMVSDFKSSGYNTLVMGTTCLTCLSLAWVVFVTLRVSQELGRHMRNFQFFNYHQMHDFYRMIAVVLYVIYNAVISMCSEGDLSGYSYYSLQSHTAIAILISQVGLISILILIDSRSLLRRAELTEEKLHVRLGLLRDSSHEIRGALNTVLMGLELIRSDAGDVITCLDSLPGTPGSMLDVESVDLSPIQLLEPLCKARSIIEHNNLVKESSVLALETLNDMLIFDKLGEQKLMLDLKDVEVWSFVRETVRPFAISAAMSSTAISSRCVDEASMWTDKYRIKADKFKLSQVMRNFMSNALKFARSEGGRVEVIVEKVVPPHRKMMHASKVVSAMRECPQEFVRVSVVDNGCGISLENQCKLFGQYVQFNANEQQKGGGSGLGLRISKDLVELHGGIIGAKSDGENTGSTFFFEVPLYGRPAIEGGHRKGEGDEPPSKILPTTGDKQCDAPMMPAAAAVVTETLSVKDAVSAAVIVAESDDACFGSSALFKATKRSAQAELPVVETPARPMSPLLSTASRTIPELMEHEGATSTLTNSRCRLSFLIVDDSATSRKLTKRLLSLHGHEVEEASDGMDFLRMMGAATDSEISDRGVMKQDSPSLKAVDVILIDDVMPHLSGPDATAAIRSYGYTGLIIGVTGNVFESQVAFFRSKGADMVLPKPLDLRDLEDVIRQKIPQAILIAETATGAAAAATAAARSKLMH